MKCDFIFHEADFIFHDNIKITTCMSRQSETINENK